jgi:hypothetical protein
MIGVRGRGRTTGFHHLYQQPYEISYFARAHFFASPGLWGKFKSIPHKRRTAQSLLRTFVTSTRLADVDCAAGAARSHLTLRLKWVVC